MTFYGVQRDGHCKRDDRTLISIYLAKLRWSITDGI